MMKRAWSIAVGCVIAILMGLSVTQADDFVEDVYYWADVKTQTKNGTVTPTYNPRAREIIFIDDTVAAQPKDTVRAILRDAL